jgi:hypothetical protein
MAAGALAVVLDFVQPVGAGRDRSSCRWQAKFQRKRHVEKDRCCLRKIRIPHQNGPGVGSAEAVKPLGEVSPRNWGALGFRGARMI